MGTVNEIFIRERTPFILPAKNFEYLSSAKRAT